MSIRIGEQASTAFLEAADILRFARFPEMQGLIFFGAPKPAVREHVVSEKQGLNFGPFPRRVRDATRDHGLRILRRLDSCLDGTFDDAVEP